LLSRPDDKQVARIVLVMQRVHQDDLAGYLEEQGGFEILNLPAIATQTKTYELRAGRTYVRQQGELLHPAHEPESVLLELKREMGPVAFSAQYQQSPIPPGGTIIKRKWLASYDAVPTHNRGDHIIMSWDVALSEEEKGDYFACVVLLRRKEVFFVWKSFEGVCGLTTSSARFWRSKNAMGSQLLRSGGGETDPVGRAAAPTRYH